MRNQLHLQMPGKLELGFAVSAIVAAGSLFLVGLAGAGADSWRGGLAASSMLLGFCALAGIWTDASTRSGPHTGLAAWFHRNDANRRGWLGIRLLDRAQSVAGYARALADYDSLLDQGLVGTAQANSRACETLDLAASNAEALGTAVRGVTFEIERAAGLSARLAQTAFSARNCLIALSGNAEAVERAVSGLVTALGASGLEATLPQDVADGLDAMLASVRDNRAQAAQALTRVHDLSDAVETQHRFAQGLSQAVMQQGTEIRLLIERLAATHMQVDTASAQLDQLTLARYEHARAASAFDAAAGDLPVHANAISEILSGLPDLRSMKARPGPSGDARPGATPPDQAGAVLRSPLRGDGPRLHFFQKPNI